MQVWCEALRATDATSVSDFAIIPARSRHGQGTQGRYLSLCAADASYWALISGTFTSRQQELANDEGNQHLGGTLSGEKGENNKARQKKRLDLPAAPEARKQAVSS